MRVTVTRKWERLEVQVTLRRNGEALSWHHPPLLDFYPPAARALRELTDATSCTLRENDATTLIVLFPTPQQAQRAKEEAVKVLKELVRSK